MKDKITVAFEQITKKAVIDTLTNKLTVILTASMQTNQFEFFSDAISEYFDSLISEITTNDKTE